MVFFGGGDRPENDSSGSHHLAQCSVFFTKNQQQKIVGLLLLMDTGPSFTGVNQNMFW